MIPYWALVILTIAKLQVTDFAFQYGAYSSRDMCERDRERIEFSTLVERDWRQTIELDNKLQLIACVKIEE